MWIDWLDLPKLTTLKTLYTYGNSFANPRHITLESDSHPLWMMFRHAQSHRCVSFRSIRLQEWRHNQREYSPYPSLTNRHRSSSALLQLIKSLSPFPFHFMFIWCTHSTSHFHFRHLKWQLYQERNYITSVNPLFPLAVAPICSLTLSRLAKEYNPKTIKRKRKTIRTAGIEPATLRSTV